MRFNPELDGRTLDIVHSLNSARKKINQRNKTFEHSLKKQQHQQTNTYLGTCLLSIDLVVSLILVPRSQFC